MPTLHDRPSTSQNTAQPTLQPPQPVPTPTAHVESTDVSVQTESNSREIATQTVITGPVLAATIFPDS